MGSDPDGSFISLLLSTDPTAAAVKSAVFLVMLLIIIILSLFCGSVVTASQTEVRRLSDHGSKKAGKALFLLGGEEKYIRSAHAGIVIAEALYFISAQAAFYQETILAEMETLRGWTDQAEAIIPDQYLPYPTYEQMLFSLR